MARILVVDDDEAILRGMQMILSGAGHDVQAADSGQAALDTLDACGPDLPDLVVVDVLMPGMTGIQMLERVRARSEWVAIPFLVISAADMSEVSTAPLGAVTFLHKPFDDKTLLEAVEAAL